MFFLFLLCQVNPYLHFEQHYDTHPFRNGCELNRPLTRLDGVSHLATMPFLGPVPSICQQTIRMFIRACSCGFPYKRQFEKLKQTTISSAPIKLAQAGGATTLARIRLYAQPLSSLTHSLSSSFAVRSGLYTRWSLAMRFMTQTSRRAIPYAIYIYINMLQTSG